MNTLFPTCRTLNEILAQMLEEPQTVSALSNRSMPEKWFPSPGECECPLGLSKTYNMLGAFPQY